MSASISNFSMRTFKFTRTSSDLSKEKKPSIIWQSDYHQILTSSPIDGIIDKIEKHVNSSTEVAINSSSLTPEISLKKEENVSKFSPSFSINSAVVFDHCYCRRSLAEVFPEEYEFFEYRKREIPSLLSDKLLSLGKRKRERSPPVNLYKRRRDVRFNEGELFAEEKVESESTKESNAWRFGPAQLWYDMLGIPENGSGFDYGMKLKKVDEDGRKNSQGQVMSDETFLMVAQTMWEDDIVWDDSDEAIQKVIQDLNHQSRASGWWIKTDQSKVSRLLKKNLARRSLFSVENEKDLSEGYSLFPVENDELVYGTWEDEIIWDAEAMRKIPEPKIPTLNLNDEEIVYNRPEAGTNVPPLLPSEPSNLDMFNISNDCHYFPARSVKVASVRRIQHSTPVIDLRASFVPIEMNADRLRNFHRPRLESFFDNAPHEVETLTERIQNMSKRREEERVVCGGSAEFFMRTVEDLSGRDGELILVEYCEEHPPLINQVGMCSRINNYYERKIPKDEGPTHYRYGEAVPTQSSLFLGSLKPGQSLQAIENNMYRAPIYEHGITETDFLVIRNGDQLFIREYGGLFVAGQLCPLIEVPRPKSKETRKLTRDVLRGLIYHQFGQSEYMPQRIRVEDAKEAFPSYSEAQLRSALKLCASIERIGTDSWWILKPDFHLPSANEIGAMFSPEDCCAYNSMMAAIQRLNDAGYGAKYFFVDESEDLEHQMDDEIKAAPWNTTHAYLQYVKRKCLLQLDEPADPSDYGEGFVYVQMPLNSVDEKQLPKRARTRVSTVLRKKSRPRAKRLLHRNFGIPRDSKTEKLAIQLTRIVHAGTENMSECSRRNVSMPQDRDTFKEEYQRIFELQNRILSSAEIMSSDDEAERSDEENDSEVDEMAKIIESMLLNERKTFKQLSREQEEKERHELVRLMLSEDAWNEKRKDRQTNNSNHSRRVLRIQRTFKNAENSDCTTRVEEVRNQAVIDAYIRVRETKDEAFIKRFLAADAGAKFRSTVKCGACGMIGHTRRNQICPQHGAPVREPEKQRCNNKSGGFVKTERFSNSIGL